MPSDYLSDISSGWENDYPAPGSEPYSGTTVEIPDGGSVGAPGADSGWFQSLLSSLGNISPGLIGALAGASGPLAGLIGNLTSGGVTGNQSQNSNSSLSGSTSGFSNQNQTGSSQTQQTGSSQTTGSTNQSQNQLGFSNTSSTPVLDPRAAATADRLNALFGGGFVGSAQGAYNDALGMLRSLASGQGGIQASAPGAPNTTPRAAPVTGFTTQLPSEIDQGLVNLIKQAFQGFTGDIAKSAITGARERGFAGGADLLQTAAAPIAGEALARVPAEQAKAYLEQALARYVAQNNAAAQKANAEAGALNAATNALGPGVQAYGADVNRYLGELNAGNQQIVNKASLISAMMDPMKLFIQSNLGLLNALPVGQHQNTLSGGNSTLSGTTNSNTNSAQMSNTQSNSQSNTQSGGTSNQTGSSNSNQSQSQPFGNVVGNGIGNIIGGAAQGYAAGSGNNSLNLLQAMLRG